MCCLRTQRCSNPQFLCTISFRGCDGLNAKTLIRFTVYDVRERVSQTAVPLGSAEITLGVILDTTRLRIALQSNNGNAGFITLTSWTPDQDRKAPRSPARRSQPQPMSHRRSQSLPPKLGVKLFVPPQGQLPMIFKNPTVSSCPLIPTYTWNFPFENYVFLFSCPDSYISPAFGSGRRHQRTRVNDGESIVFHHSAAITVSIEYAMGKISAV